MPKISVSLPASALEFLDTLDDNRSRALAKIVEDYRRRRKSEELARAYDAYAQFCRQDDGDWWSDWEASSAADLAGSS